MESVDGMLIKVAKDGPYLVSGSVPLSRETITADAEGESAEWVLDQHLDDRERCGLCRCGHSGRKPFCDGSHMDVSFDGTETASRISYAERAVAIPGPTLTLYDVPELCAEARFCHRAGGAWHLVESAEEGAPETVIEECANCPSGRYTVAETASGAVIEPVLPPSIAFVTDPEKSRSGPIWVRGGIRIESADGEAYEVRNRVTLCRCGMSSNKPFCDGTHIECGFHEEAH